MRCKKINVYYLNFFFQFNFTIFEYFILLLVNVEQNITLIYFKKNQIEDKFTNKNEMWNVYYKTKKLTPN